MLRMFASLVIVGFAAAQDKPSMRGTASDKQAFAGEVDAMHTYINTYRKSMGLSELIKDPVLVKCANRTALVMNNARQLNHTLGNSTTTSRMSHMGFNTTDKKVGELFGVNSCRVSVDVCSKLMVDQWVNDPEFKRTLSSKDFSLFGAAALPGYYDDDAGDDITVSTGRRLGADAGNATDDGGMLLNPAKKYNWGTYVVHFAQ